MITPADIQNKEFSKGFRGYSEEEVDMFLDLITLDLEKLIKENINLKAQLATLEKKETTMAETDVSVKETLISAKSLMEDIAESSEKRAKALLHNAELDAALIIKDAKIKADRIVEESSAYTRAFDSFKREYKAMLDRQLLMFEKDVDRLGYDRLESILQDENFKEEPIKGSETDEAVGEREPQNSYVEEDPDLKKTMVNMKYSE